MVERAKPFIITTDTVVVVSLELCTPSLHKLCRTFGRAVSFYPWLHCRKCQLKLLHCCSHPHLLADAPRSDRGSCACSFVILSGTGGMAGWVVTCSACSGSLEPNWWLIRLWVYGWLQSFPSPFPFEEKQDVNNQSISFIWFYFCYVFSGNINNLAPCLRSSKAHLPAWFQVYFRKYYRRENSRCNSEPPN